MDMDSSTVSIMSSTNISYIVLPDIAPIPCPHRDKLEQSVWFTTYINTCVP